MQLYILDKDPVKCAELLPQKFQFKMLLELAQMMSTVTGCGTYKPVSQGKEIQYFIKQYPDWVCRYFWKLHSLVRNHTNLKEKTDNDLVEIYNNYVIKYNDGREQFPPYAPFRYAKEYVCKIPSQSVLPIDECVAEYTKYLEWKLQCKK